MAAWQQMAAASASGRSDAGVPNSNGRLVRSLVTQQQQERRQQKALMAPAGRAQADVCIQQHAAVCM
jgi:hypothetical protein